MKNKNIKNAKIILGILIVVVLTLILNKTRVNILKQNERLVNKTIEIKQKLLKQEGNINVKSIYGKVFLTQTNQSLNSIELTLYKEDKNGEFNKQEVTYTDNNGNYKFTKIENGKYNIKLGDNSEYKIINDDSIVIENIESINRKEVNLELVQFDSFKAEIKKYIKEIKLNNNGKELVYTYDRQNKVNISVKNMKNITGTVTYEFEVTNNKTKNGYVKVIKDIIPNGLSFNKEKNKYWKEKNGRLYTTQLSNEILKVGETKKVELVLDIKNTNEAKSYLNKVSITGEVYHKLTYINLGKIYSQIEILDGDTAIKESNLVREGYLFTGWYKDDKLTKKFNFDEPITSDTNVYAGWAKQVNVKYVIGTETYKEEVINEGTKTTKPENPSKEGYSFAGWYKDDKLTTKFNFDDLINIDTIIYGKLNENINEHTVLFKDNDKDYNKQTVNHNGLIQIPENPNRKGFIFKYWSLSKDGEEYNLKTPVTDDLILYSVYKKAEYKVTYYIDNKLWKEETLKFGSNAEDKVAPLKDPNEKESTIVSYQFKGWYNKNNELFDFNTLINDNLDLYGSYEEAESCKTLENIKIPTKEEIINKVNNRYETIDLNGDNANITSNDDNGAHMIIDGFEVLYSDSSLDYSIISYKGTDIPDDLYIPDMINGIPVTKIINSAFSGGEYKNIIFSKTLKSIVNGSFTRANIEKVDFSKAVSLEELTEGAFSYSTIGTVDFGNAINLGSIINSSFSSGTISNLKFNNTISLTEINSGAFNNTKIKNIDFGNAINLSTIGGGTFTNIDVEVLNLSKLFSLETIDVGMFGPGTSSIKKIIFGRGIKNIKQASLSYSSIEEIIFDCAQNLEEIGSNAFENNHIRNFKLENMPNFDNLSFYMLVDNPIESIILKDLTGLKNYTPQGLESSATPDTEGFSLVLDNVGFEQILINFMDLSKLTRLEVKNMTELSEISRLAFAKNENLQSITLENLPKLENIGDRAFAGNINVENLIIKDLPELITIGNQAFSDLRKLPELTLSDLPKLTTIGHNSFVYNNSLSKLNLVNLPELTTIEERAFINSPITELSFTSENTPKLTRIGLFAFAGNNKFYDEAGSGTKYGSLKSITMKDLPYFDFNNSFYSIFDTTGIENIELTNLDNLVNLPHLIDSNNDDLDVSVTITDCDKLDLKDTMSVSSNITNLVLDNLPATTSFKSGAFDNNKIKNLDLSGLENLVTINEGAFGNNPIKVIKLPASLTTISQGAFIQNLDINCIEIGGDSERFNSSWTDIGFPETLTPNVCVIYDEEEPTLLDLVGDIININMNNNIDKKVYNIVLYKMDNNTLIDNNSKYKLQKYENGSYKDIIVSEDYDDVGRFIIGNKDNSLITPFNNKVYISNIDTGLYRMIDNSNSNNTLTFIIESNGVTTGNVKINKATNNNRIMSESEAEFITSIQTGQFQSKYIIIILGIVLTLSTLFLIKRKSKLKQ